MKFIKKPIVIEAIQFTGQSSITAMQNVWMNFQHLSEYRHESRTLVIKTPEGPLNASLNDWVIKGVKGEFYPCKPDIFEATYELPTEKEGGE